MCSLSIVDVDGTANSIQILSVAQNAAIATLMSLTTMKPADIFM